MIENKSLRSKIFDILNIVILIAITLICIVPVWYVRLSNDLKIQSDVRYFYLRYFYIRFF